MIANNQNRSTMILDQLSQWPRYARLHPRFAAAFRYLETLTPQTPVGRVELAGNDLFVSVQTYPTRPVEQCRFEAHRQYADIQFLITGREQILWSPLPATTAPYNAEKDILFFATPAVATPLHLVAGQFAVFFPADGHAPGCDLSGTATVLKAVVKVRL